MIHKKILSLLVLLMTAASGAWAAELTVSVGTDKISELPIDATSNNLYQKNEMVYPATALTAMTGQFITAIQFYANQENISLDGQYTVRMKEVSTFGIMPGIDGHPYHTDNTEDMPSKTVYEGELSVANSKLTVTFTTPYVYNGGNLVIAFYTKTPGSSEGSSLKFYGVDYGIDHCIGVSRATENSLEEIYRGTGLATLPKATFTYTYVEMNDDMTEAKFDMPASDVTVDYELVRDMEIAVNAVMPASIRIQQKQQGGGYEAVEPAKMIPEVKDAIDGEDQAVTMTKVTPETAETGDYTLKLQKLVVGDVETWVDAEPNDFSVGTYRYEVTGANLYDGVCYTNEFKLFEGYPVTVPAHGFVTYYSDENLTVDETSDAQLYTITAVSGNNATATPITSANKLTPFLIYNPTDEEQTFMLIPTDNQINLSVYPGFKGTLVDKTFTAAEMADVDFYVVNNAQFVWVKDPGTIAANRCWLETAKNSAARAITILFGDATGITAVSGSAADNGDIYDLNGRKVQKPVKKGVYIQNGQKKVMK